MNKQQLNQITKIIAEKFNPERIIIFGSQAFGEPSRNSDVDILVVRETEEDYFQRAVPIRLALRGFGYPFDIIVRTPEEFEAERSVYWSVVAEAAQNGIVFYEKAA